MGLLITASQSVIFWPSYSKYAETGTGCALLIHFAPVAALTLALAWEAMTTTPRKVKSLVSVSQTKRGIVGWIGWPTPAATAALIVALISPIGLLLNPLSHPIEAERFAFETNDFTVVVGQTTSTDQGQRFENSPLRVGVWLARRLLPLAKYIIAEDDRRWRFSVT